MIRVLEYLPYKGRLREVGSFNWNRQGFRENSLQLSSTSRELIHMRETDFLHGQIMTGQGGIAVDDPPPEVLEARLDGDPSNSAHSSKIGTSGFSERNI